MVLVSMVLHGFELGGGHGRSVSMLARLAAAMGGLGLEADRQRLETDRQTDTLETRRQIEILQTDRQTHYK